jgi:hypothetical protein
VLVLVGQIQPHEALSRDGEYMNPDEVGEDPACRRVLNARAFLVRKGGRLLLQDRADAVFEGCLDEPTHGPDHQQGHDALRFFQRAGGRQKLRSFQEAKPALCLGVPFEAGEHGRSSSRALVQGVRREAKTAVLVHTRLAVRAPRREGSGDRVDALGGLGASMGAPAAHTGAWGRWYCQRAMWSARRGPNASGPVGHPLHRQRPCDPVSGRL